MSKKLPPPLLIPWLYATGSLTQQLKQLGQGQFHVEQISAQFIKLKLVDARWLKMPYVHTSWVREAYLYGHQHDPWVKAKSIFPILSLQKKARIFRFLGNRPIGYFLFQRTQPKCERRILYLKEGWTRQSCYTWHGCKFIVQETFLPAFEKVLQGSS